MLKPKFTLSLNILLAVILLFSCNNSNRQKAYRPGSISGDLIIFHAGSLSVPFQKIARAFEQEYPGTHVLLEAAGSVDCARKITDLHKPCDLMASSDYSVITKFLIPDHASWYLPFAGNEMVIAFTGKSKNSDVISKDNWVDILMQDDVHFGRSDPNADPCGYRTLILLQLAGNYYGIHDLGSILASKDVKYIRPKEVDLLAMLELHETDYIFIYRSVAIQHNLRYLELPDEINLKDMKRDEQYRKATVKIQGSSPNNFIEVHGEAITYAITQPDNAPNPAVARAFLHFLLDHSRGMKILEECGHNSLIPLPIKNGLFLPDDLLKYTYNPEDSL
jgi:molybdate/tungstate transport system substrate-binding protein